MIALLLTLLAQPRGLEKLQAVPFTDVRITDSFWAPRRETNRKVSIPHSLDMLEKAGNMANFDLAAKHARSGYTGPVFMDSDAYKAIEAASYSLATDPDPALDKRLDSMIARIAAAQMPDGYLNTWYEVNAPDQHWTNLRDNHELYCAGHLFEAASAHYLATRKRNLLDVATKFADHIAERFGNGDGRREGYGGHPEIELALVKLWRVTGTQRYFDTARYFIDHRGDKFFAKEHNTPLDRYDGSYWQDNVPIREHREIVGHAVRAGYLFSGTVDVAAQTGDEGLLSMVDRGWKNTTGKKMYVTGGIGPSASNEGFTEDYDLPNLTAYQETCASVAMAMWNYRLSLLYGDSKYADLVELALYNGVLAGVSLDGRKFFYVNPLESRGDHHRSDWFGCACCPPNETRTLASLGGYAYARGSDSLWVNLYIQGSLDTQVGDVSVGLKVKTDYPWDGKVDLSFTRIYGKMALHLRVPGWCDSPSVAVNRKRTRATNQNGYLVVERTWEAGDKVELNLPMPARRIQSNPNVKDNVGSLALARGPLIYCLEQTDQSAPVDSISLPAAVAIKNEKSAALGGVVLLRGEGLAASRDWGGGLYRSLAAPTKVMVTAIPYYAWDNREAGSMRVWIPTNPETPIAGGAERTAKVSVSYKSGNAQPWGVNDGLEPTSSGQQPSALCHWWPHKGAEEWIQYDWDKPISATGVKVYWFDDTGRGECRYPSSWMILFKDGDTWKPVSGAKYSINSNAWCATSFDLVRTTALRLVVQMSDGWAAGVHEWKVITEE